MNEPSSPTSPNPGGPDSLEDLVQQIPRLGQSATAYLGATLQLIILQLKKNLFSTLFWILLVILIFQATALALSLLLHGAGEGLGLVLGQRVWLGNIVVGGAFLVLVLLGGLIGWKSLSRSLRKKSLEPPEAERSFQEALGSMREDFLGIFKIQAWVDRYPLPTTGAVAVLGFWVGGNLVDGSTEDASSKSAQGPVMDQSAWAHSLANVLMNTGSDILKEAAHLWLQKNLEMTSPKTGPTT